MPRNGLPLLLLLLQLAAANAALTLNIYNNTAHAGEPSSTRLVPSIAFSVDASKPFSAELVGTLNAQDGETYSFSCNFGGATLAYLHVDDHLLCQTGANSPSGTVAGTTDDPLPVMSRTALPIRLAVVHPGPKQASQPQINISVTVKTLSATNAAASCPPAGDWQENTDFPGNDLPGPRKAVATKEECCALCASTRGCTALSWDSPRSKYKTKTCNMKSKADSKKSVTGLWGLKAIDSKPTPAPAPLAFSPMLPAAEVQRRKMQRSLLQGWG